MANGQELADTIQPEFEAFFTGEKGDSIFQTMQTQSQQILTKK
jgi:multiple sugar transport system substrate-binding protein